MKGFYSRLALNGIRKNARLYLPYIFTCVGVIMMYYIMSFLSVSPAVGAIKGGSTTRVILLLGKWVIAIFAVILLLYTHSFLIRRRRKEFGLYNVLGMDKRNLTRVLSLETVYVAAVSIIGGLVLGIALAKFAEMILLSITNGYVTYDFSISGSSLIETAAIFLAIFFVIFLKTVAGIRLSSPIELLRSENHGEKPPRGNAIIGILGVLLLAVAYTLSVSIKDPISALSWFFIAVIMVIVGTYLTFISGSVLLCRILKKNKKYYYKKSHFVSVSSMAYRMKRNGAGLASICILGTMVLVMIASSACLFFGSEESLSSRYPRGITMEGRFDTTEETIEKSEFIMTSAKKRAAEAGTQQTNIIGYRYAQITGLLDGDSIEIDSSKINSMVDYSKLRTVYFVSLSDYNSICDGNFTLRDGEAILFQTRGNYEKKKINIGGITLDVADVARNFPITGLSTVNVISSMFLIVPDLDVTVAPISQLNDYSGSAMLLRKWFYGFDTDLDADGEEALCGNIAQDIRNSDINNGTVFVASRESYRADFFTTFGSLLFLGAMLSLVFIVAAALIIYYKQISEGYEDASRFDIMQKVGMTNSDIRKSINSQMLTVFFMPLAAAALHLCFAFPLIRKLLMLFNLANLPLLLLTTGITVLVFALFYALVYKLTSNAYYKIVAQR